MKGLQQRKWTIREEDDHLHTKLSLSTAWGIGCRVQGFRISGFRILGLGFRDQGSGFRVQGSGFRVQGLGFRPEGWCPTFRVIFLERHHRARQAQLKYNFPFASPSAVST